MEYISPYERDRIRFQDASAELLEKVDEQTRAEVRADFYKCAEANTWGALSLMGVMGAMAVRVVLMNLLYGIPLELPPVVAQAIREAGEALETPLPTCASCGYGLPRSFSVCPLCGGRVALN